MVTNKNLIFIPKQNNHMPSLKWLRPVTGVYGTLVLQKLNKPQQKKQVQHPSSQTRDLLWI